MKPDAPALESKLSDIVYVIAWSEHGPAKVGITRTLGSRLIQLQNGNPYPLKVFHSLRFLNPGKAAEIEARVLLSMKTMALKGHWLNTTPARVFDEIQRHAKELSAIVREPTKRQPRRALEKERLRAQDAVTQFESLTGRTVKMRPRSAEKWLLVRRAKSTAC